MNNSTSLEHPNEDDPMLSECLKEQILNGKEREEEEVDEDALGISSSSRSSLLTNIPLNIRADLLRPDEVEDQSDQNDGEEKAKRIGNDDEDDDALAQQSRPLLSTSTIPVGLVRARKSAKKRGRRRQQVHLNNLDLQSQLTRASSSPASSCFHTCLLWCCRTSRNVQSTISCMNLLARLLFWSTIVASVAGVCWYSYELFNHGTEPHRVAWFSAGAFVLLGFPISMWGIVTHLANYNQPHTQVYIVRILWMVPIYSIESWLAMRFHKQAIYIETLRDFYESYVLYSFLQFLIQVLGGEEALILMLKDKSPTRGVHMWGLQFFVKPWLMGQPLRKTVYERTDSNKSRRAMKRVHWISPFFVKCKFGVLQYVLLKFLSAIAVLGLEWKGWYKEGVFSWRGGYLYICILTNLSQCWALYCLIFFYYATKNELSPIRPVGKFLSVKALVFFTWWQSVMIAMLYQGGMIPEQLVNVEHDWTTEDVAKGLQDYLICIEMFVAAVVHTFVFPHTEYTPEAVTARNRALQHHHTATLGSSANKTKWHHRRLGRSKYHLHPYSRHWSTIRDDMSKSSAMPSHAGGVEMMSLESTSQHTTEMWEERSWQPVQPHSEADNRSSRSNSLDALWDLSASDLSLATEEMQNKVSKDVESGVPTREDGKKALETVIDVTEYDDEDNVAAAVEEEEEDDESTGEGSFADDDASFQEDDHHGGTAASPTYNPGFVRALLDSAIPRDLGDNTIGIVKGDYHVEKKTLLHVAATSDQYDLFSPNRRRIPGKRKTGE